MTNSVEQTLNKKDEFNNKTTEEKDINDDTLDNKELAKLKFIIYENWNVKFTIKQLQELLVVAYAFNNNNDLIICRYGMQNDLVFKHNKRFKNKHNKDNFLKNADSMFI